MTSFVISTHTDPADAGPLRTALEHVADELAAARRKFPGFSSRHEGYAILLEEMDELWQEIKHGTPERAREEAVQVAAMAIRFITDCCK
jgi:hypothetical protein